MSVCGGSAQGVESHSNACGVGVPRKLRGGIASCAAASGRTRPMWIMGLLSLAPAQVYSPASGASLRPEATPHPGGRRGLGGGGGFTTYICGGQPPPPPGWVKPHLTKTDQSAPQPTHPQIGGQTLPKPLQASIAKAMAEVARYHVVTVTNAPHDPPHGPQLGTLVVYQPAKGAPVWSLASFDCNKAHSLCPNGQDRRPFLGCEGMDAKCYWVDLFAQVRGFPWVHSKRWCGSVLTERRRRQRLLYPDGQG